MRELIGQLAENVVNEIMGAEAGQPCESADNSGNGFRERRLTACVGTLTLGIPKLRASGFFPDDVLMRYQRAHHAIVADSEMYATGTSTRKVKKVARFDTIVRNAPLLTASRILLHLLMDISPFRAEASHIGLVHDKGRYGAKPSTVPPLLTDGVPNKNDCRYQVHYYSSAVVP